MRKVAFYTLGCKLNFSESSAISRSFEQRGYTKVGFSESPDIFIINTCSVTENADKKCKKIVKEAQKINPSGYVAVIGCYAQLKPKEIAQIPGVDAVLGAAEKFRLPELLDSFKKTPQAKIFTSQIREAKAFNSAYSINDRTRTFLKVQDGCDYHCSFCTIPLARGKSRSDSIENILKSVREIAITEVKEVVLTGVNIGDFGIVNGMREARFIDLVKAIDRIEGIERVRISSIEPNLLTNELIEFVSRARCFVPHFHIPLQSGNNKILRAMRRRYLRELYEDRINKIKQLMPDCCIGVDVIVGFPGETHEDFLETYHFLNSLDISYLHVFTYSERANTNAAKMNKVVPLKERQQRAKMLRNLSEKKKGAFYTAQSGTVRTVLFEEDVQEDRIHGFTENYVRVNARYDPLLVNETKKVMLTSITENGTVGVEEAEAANVFAEVPAL